MINIQIILIMSRTRWNWAVENVDDPDTVMEGHAADFDQACAAAHKAHDEMRERLMKP